MGSRTRFGNPINMVLTDDIAELAMDFKKVLLSEACALHILRQKIMRSVMNWSRKLEEECGRMMKVRRRKGNRGGTTRGTRAICHKEVSLRAGCSFLAYFRVGLRHECNLTLMSIIEIVWEFLYSEKAKTQAMQSNMRSGERIFKWWGLCREVYARIIDLQPQFFGTDDNPIQIDDSYFCGRRK